MTTLITSTTLTSGYQLTSDTTGTLTIQTGSGPTTAMIINSSGLVGVGNTPFQYGASTSVGAELSIQSSASTNAALTVQAGLSRYWIATPSGTNQLQIGGNGGSMPASGAINVDASGNVGIGASVNNTYDNVAQPRPLLVQSSSTATTAGSSTNAITISNSDTTTNNLSQLNFAAITGANTSQFSAAWIACQYGARTNGQYPTGQLIFATSTALNNAPSEKLRINSAGTLSITQTAGTNTIDVSGNATSIANGGTVAFPNASGMLVVNNHTNGAVTIYLGGGGATTAVSSVGAQVGTFAYTAGNAGYTWTSNYGSTATYSFYFLKTRPTA
jgi:hypothetical protein